MLIKHFIPPCLPSAYALSPLKGGAGDLGAHCMCASGTQCSRAAGLHKDTPLSSPSPSRGWECRCPGCREKRGKHRRVKEQHSGLGSPCVRATLPSAGKEGRQGPSRPPAALQDGAPALSHPGSRSGCLVSTCRVSGPAPFMRALDAGLLGASSRGKLKGRGQAAVKVTLPGRGTRFPPRDNSPEM